MLRRGYESQCKDYSFVTAEACDFCQVVSQMSSACYDKAPSRISNTRKRAQNSYFWRNSLRRPPWNSF